MCVWTLSKVMRTSLVNTPMLQRLVTLLNDDDGGIVLGTLCTLSNVLCASMVSHPMLEQLEALLHSDNAIIVHKSTTLLGIIAFQFELKALSERQQALRERVTIQATQRAQDYWCWLNKDGSSGGPLSTQQLQSTVLQECKHIWIQGESRFIKCKTDITPYIEQWQSGCKKYQTWIEEKALHPQLLPETITLSKHHCPLFKTTEYSLCSNAQCESVLVPQELFQYRCFQHGFDLCVRCAFSFGAKEFFEDTFDSSDSSTDSSEYSSYSSTDDSSEYTSD
mmetsp:Transcript_11924/g.17983  ORF Transcript_11924/g.17983 Transcript_11924/m.17983 type:complete len:279 (-) Transcript_11924:23-859(-)